MNDKNTLSLIEAFYVREMIDEEAYQRACRYLAFSDPGLTDEAAVLAWMKRYGINRRQREQTPTPPIEPATAAPDAGLAVQSHYLDNEPLFYEPVAAVVVSPVPEPEPEPEHLDTAAVATPALTDTRMTRSAERAEPSSAANRIKINKARKSQASGSVLSQIVALNRETLTLVTQNVPMKAKRVRVFQEKLAECYYLFSDDTELLNWGESAFVIPYNMQKPNLPRSILMWLFELYAAKHIDRKGYSAIYSTLVEFNRHDALSIDSKSDLLDWIDNDYKANPQVNRSAAKSLSAHRGKPSGGGKMPAIEENASGFSLGCVVIIVFMILVFMAL